MAEEKRKTRKKLYVYLDADVLSHLAELDTILYKNPDADLTLDRNPILRQDGYYFKLFLRLIQEDQIRIVIGPTTYGEIKRMKSILQFVKKHAYVPELNIFNFTKYTREIDDLAKEYCTKSYVYRGQKYDAPMSLVYDPRTHVDVPSTDAYFVAEASKENAISLTCNGKHMIFRKYNEEDTTSRAVGVRLINESHGFCTVFPDGKVITAGPMLFKTFVKLVSDGLERFEAGEVDESHFEKASNHSKDLEL